MVGLRQCPSAVAVRRAVHSVRLAYIKRQLDGFQKLFEQRVGFDFPAASEGNSRPAVAGLGGGLVTVLRGGLVTVLRETAGNVGVFGSGLTRQRLALFAIPAGLLARRHAVRVHVFDELHYGLQFFFRGKLGL